MSDKRFEIVGIRANAPATPLRRERWYRRWPLFSILLLGIIILGCLLAEFIMPRDPGYMDLLNCSKAPCRAFPFGTDALGRDLFSMIWYGGRASLCIGFLSTLLSTLIAIVFGSLSGMAPPWLDRLLTRTSEIVLSIPNLLLVVFLQAILGKANVISLSIVIGLTSWMSIAKVVRTEVLRLRSSEYVIAAKCMGGGFWHNLRYHLAPNFISSIMFMVVMNIRSAIMAESTLSFMGIGLPLEIISWGSMLSLADKALLGGAWWIILIPGLFLIATLMCITAIGNALRAHLNRGERKF